MRNIWEKFLNEAIKVKGLNLSELLIFKIIIKEKGHLFYIEPNGFNKLEKKKKNLDTTKQKILLKTEIDSRYERNIINKFNTDMTIWRK